MIALIIYARVHKPARCHATGNYRSCINDCEQTIKFSSKNVKAYYRAAKANAELGHATEAIRWCDEGLEVEPTNEMLIKVCGDTLCPY